MSLAQTKKLRENLCEMVDKLKIFGITSELLDNSHVYFLGVEDGIALWLSEDKGYFYTDMELNLLFDRYFDYATPFSAEQAVVYFDHEWRILDVNDVTITEIPSEIDLKKGRTMVNGNIATFDDRFGKWGSFKYDSKDHSFTWDLPFIWDRLEFSRHERFAYAGCDTYVSERESIDGAHSLTSNYGGIISGRDKAEYDRLRRMEESRSYRTCYTTVYRLPIEYFKDMNIFKCKLESLKRESGYLLESRKVIGKLYDLRNDIDSALKKELASKIDIRDDYFSDELETRSFDIKCRVKEKRLSNYKLVNGIYREKSN